MMDLKKFIRKLNIASLILVMGSLPFSVWYNGVCLIIFYATSVAFIINEKGKIDLSPQDLKFPLVFVSQFIIYLLVVISGGFNHGFILEKKITILLFPLFLGLDSLKYSPKEIDLLLGAFVGSTLIAAILPFLFNLDYLMHRDIAIQNYLVMDRPYFALYSILCVFILIYFMTKSERPFMKALCLLISLFFAYFTYIIFAKMVFISFFLTLIICVGIHYIQSRQYKRLTIFISSIAFFAIAVIAVNKEVQSFLQGIMKLQPFDMSEGKYVYFLSINTRYVIWDCSIQLLLDGYNWILGCGLDYQNILDACYSQNWEKYGIRTVDGVDPMFLESHFNPHNEFLQTWIETGLVGFIALIAAATYALKLAIQKRNYLFAAFTVFFFISCLTESYLTRQKGIVLYALFNSLFAFQMRNDSHLK